MSQLKIATVSLISVLVRPKKTTKYLILCSWQFYPHSKERAVLTRKERTGERRMLQVIYLVTSCCSPQLHIGYVPASVLMLISQVSRKQA
jgi:hypothetical protein